MYYNFKHVEYIGNNVFKVTLTKFLYYYEKEYRGFKIDNKLDLINIDISKEYLIYFKDNFYLLTCSTFNNDYFCRCQQADTRFYKINNLSFTKMSNEEIIDLFNISWGKKEDLGYYGSTIKKSEFLDMTDERKKVYSVYNYFSKMHSEYKRRVRMLERFRLEGKALEKDIEEEISKIPNIDHPIFKILIKPFLDKPLFEKSEKHILDKFETKYSSIFWYFFYKNKNNDFDLYLAPVYILEKDKNTFLYIKGQKKEVLYRELDMYASCCGSGNYFFYKIKIERWIDMTEDELKKRLGLYCSKCDKYLEKYEREEDHCFKCY